MASRGPDQPTWPENYPGGANTYIPNWDADVPVWGFARDPATFPVNQYVVHAPLPEPPLPEPSGEDGTMTSFADAIRRLLELPPLPQSEDSK